KGGRRWYGLGLPVTCCGGEVFKNLLMRRGGGGVEEVGFVGGRGGGPRRSPGRQLPLQGFHFLREGRRAARLREHFPRRASFHRRRTGLGIVESPFLSRRLHDADAPGHGRRRAAMAQPGAAGRAGRHARRVVRRPRRPRRRPGGGCARGGGGGKRKTKWGRFCIRREDARGPPAKPREIMPRAGPPPGLFPRRGRRGKKKELGAGPAPRQHPPPPIWMAAGT